MAELFRLVSSVLDFVWEYTFPAASNFLINNGFGLLIFATIITGIIIDTIIEIFHIN